jgi:DNA mismatch endonuclease (patch repair protein)
MRGNTRSDTRPEIELRRELHALGLRFRKNYSIRLEGVVRHLDVAFPRQRVAVFVDGCFWHGCSVHGTTPGRNAQYWAAKMERTLSRDRAVNAALRQEGWTVVRIWEHVSPKTAAIEVREVLGCAEQHTR